MTATKWNAYGPEQVEALRKVFDKVWLDVSKTGVLSQDAVAKLIFGLAADGGAEDREDIDVEQMAQEALVTIMRLVVSPSVCLDPPVPASRSTKEMQLFG